jgi:hypothetical protein
MNKAKVSFQKYVFKFFPYILDVDILQGRSVCHTVPVTRKFILCPPHFIAALPDRNLRSHQLQREATAASFALFIKV